MIRSRLSTIDYREYITRNELRRRFHITTSMVERYFPQPELINCGADGSKSFDAWKLSTVEDVMQIPGLRATSLQRLDAEAPYVRKERKKARKKLVEQSSVKTLALEVSRERKFILHVGPTNSGKTYQAIQCLKKAQNGVYLGPLRLLALEIFDRLNMDGVPCSLLTGQEKEDIPCSRVMAATIEMCDCSQHYDVAVIDECQMIANEERGANWTRAIFHLNADEIHVCLAPEALKLLASLIKDMGSEYTVEQCQRLTPLIFEGLFSKLADAKDGDALITFSRKKVLAIAAELEENGIRTSVLYGALPPAARREEVRRFNNGESSVIVATDAIGMGVTLPIRRIIFCDVMKRDQFRQRLLSAAEVQQIAGRAGRYGIYAKGAVLTMSKPEYIQSCLSTVVPALEYITVPFPSELLTENVDIKIYLEEWESLFLQPYFRRNRMKEALSLLNKLDWQLNHFDNKTLFKLITCPFDVHDVQLVDYWRSCCVAIAHDTYLPVPNFGEDSLNDCEVKYRAYEIRHHLSQRFDRKDDLEDERQQLCVKINSFLCGDKTVFILRCRMCGKRLPTTTVGLLCHDCQIKQQIAQVNEARQRASLNSLGSSARFTTTNKKKNNYHRKRKKK